MPYNNDATYIDRELTKTLIHDYAFMQTELYALSTGMNNITRKIKHKDEYYQARIYCNHCDIAKVQFEHEVLHALYKQHLHIQTPLPVTNVHGTTVSVLTDGRLVSVYKFIEGEQQASRELFYSLIEATGHVSAALAKISTEMTEAYSPYYDIKDNYPQYTPIFMKDLAERFNMDEGLVKKLLFLIETRQTLEQQRERLIKLPHQYIHGDINFSNSVVVEHKVIAILDFEFVTYDLRAMELAVLMTEYFKLYAKFDAASFEQCIQTFNSIQSLTSDEIIALPSLIQLRAVDVAMHFLTRFVDGGDSLPVLTKIIEDSFNVVTQMQTYR